MGVPGPFLSLASPWIAKSEGYFEQEGLDVEIVVAPSLQSITGVITGDFQLCSCGGADLMVMAEKGEILQAIANIQPYVDFVFMIRNDVLKASGVTTSSPLQERLALLKGKAISVSGVGGTGNQILNLMIRQAGLQQTDVRIVSLPSQAAQLAAFVEKQIDGVVGNGPLDVQVEVGGVGTVLVTSSEIPVISNVIFQAISTKASWARANPETARAFLRAIKKANQFLRTSPDAPARMHATSWASTPVSVLTVSLATIRDKFPADACFTPGQAEGTVGFAKANGTLTKSIDPAEGGFWSNAYCK